MPPLYGRDLRCWTCSPQDQSEDQEQRETQEQRANQEQTEDQEQIEEQDQEQIESCPGYRELWEGLGPYTPRSRLQYFIRVKLKRLQQRQSKQTAENEQN